MKIFLSSICLETGTDIQPALYYLKGYLLKIKPAQKGRTRISTAESGVPAIPLARGAIKRGAAQASS